MTGVLLVLVLHTACLILLTAAVWFAAKERTMPIDPSGIQAEVAALNEQLARLELIVSGIANDYTTFNSRIEALEAALAANDPTAAR
jgi:Skp family chaperone for outer membrane proteins